MIAGRISRLAATSLRPMGLVACSLVAGAFARAVIERIYEPGDTVIVEGRFTGTNTGPLAGPEGPLAPSGRKVDLPFADFSRLSGGKIVDYRTYYDQVALLTQLGLSE